MQKLKKRWKPIVLALVLLLALLLVLIQNRPLSPAADAVAITFLGYTNAPLTERRFGLFSITNRAEYDVRWHGDWVEIEGKQGRQGRLVNNLLPGKTYSPVLKSGRSFILYIGDPLYEEGQWRFQMSFAPYDFAEKWHDLSFRHKLPMRLGPLVLVDSQKILNPTNHTIASTEWLTNSTAIQPAK